MKQEVDRPLFEKLGDGVSILLCPKSCGYSMVQITDIARFDDPIGALIYGFCGHCHSTGMWSIRGDKGRTLVALMTSGPPDL